MIYAVGDIHGRLGPLEEALSRIEADGTGAPVVFLGDLVDRGPSSRQVIERLMEGQAEGRPWIVIKGNHDRMFSRFVRTGDPTDGAIKSGRTWLHDRLGGPMTLASYAGTPSFLHERGGGLDTLMSYEIDVAAERRLASVAADAREAVPEAHLDWIDALPLAHGVEGCFFVHAGIRPGVPLAEQAEDDLLWIREPFLDHTGAHPALVVHGHTPVEAPMHCGNRVNLDTGAGYGGPVTAAVFEDGEVSVLGERGRERLVPPA